MENLVFASNEGGVCDANDIMDNRIVFCVKNDEMLVLDGNGDIFVHGKLIENDKEVVNALREFLRRVEA